MEQGLELVCRDIWTVNIQKFKKFDYKTLYTKWLKKCLNCLAIEAAMPAQVKNYEEEVAKLSEEQALQRLAPRV